jgi:hypothetical protein
MRCGSTTEKLSRWVIRNTEGKGSLAGSFWLFWCGNEERSGSIHIE